METEGARDLIHLVANMYGLQLNETAETAAALSLRICGGVRCLDLSGARLPK